MREVPPRASALLRGFESRNRDWEPKKRIFVYNAAAMEEPFLQGSVLCVYLKKHACHWLSSGKHKRLLCHRLLNLLLILFNECLSLIVADI